MCATRRGIGTSGESATVLATNKRASLKRLIFFAPTLRMLNSNLGSGEAGWICMEI